ncbi:MAG TPA: endonuclease/exonuclease/phosphatase family protein [Gaiellaceae bacterium]|nr:endonuclease/exonuclease/phosphatase family protein [Gaiellaceae bacterium]
MVSWAVSSAIGRAAARGSYRVRPCCDPGGTPGVLDPLPAPLQARLLDLRAALDAVVPAKQLDRNLLVATWNLRAFGGLTESWRSEPGDSPRRDLFDVRCIAEVVSRFDVAALQEVRGNLTALRALLAVLGPQWAAIMTDVTRGRAGNDERMAFVFDLRRVKPSGLAGELVVAIEAGTSVGAEDLGRQFARTPYAVSFSAGDAALTLVTLHVLYGEETERAKELREIARWLAEWARHDRDWNQNLIALGDFNIDRRGDPLFEAFTSTGLVPAPGLDEVPRTIFATGEEAKFYDQIAWFVDPRRGPMLGLEWLSSGSFDFVPLLQGGSTKTTLSWKASDHYPLWVEFSGR